MEITLNLKTISAIVAVIAVIIGIIEGLNVFSLSGLVSDFVFYGSLAIIIAILGLLGVYISKMDIRIAAVSYTHLKLPTKSMVYISVVAVSLKKKIF